MRSPVFLLPVLFLLSCTGRTQLEKDVLSEFPASSREWQAARYLLDNLPHHSTYEGEVIARFREAVLAYDGPYSNASPVPIDSIWQAVSSEGSLSRTVPHSKRIDPGFIVDHIRTAFAHRDRCAWGDSIGFEVFCEYILPYSVRNEPLGEWRAVLHDKYYPLIEGIASPKEAFDTIYNRIYAGFEQQDNPFAFASAFTPDPLLTDRLMRGTCDVRTLYVVAVARSLCIPAAFDYVESWGNFSTRGHSWPVYVGTDGERAYVLSEYDTVSHDRGIIDAFLFRLKQPFDDSPTPYRLDSLKKPSKIFRRTFAAAEEALFGGDRLQADVSADYGLDGRIELVADRKIDGQVWLCTFLTGNDWVPIAGQTLDRSHRICFDNIGRDVTYLLAESGPNGLMPLSNPLTLHRDGSTQRRDPDTVRTETVVLHRKYLLRTTWADRGRQLVGMAFEVSDSEDFRRAQVLHTVQTPPLGIISVEIHSPRPARYIRARVPQGTGRGFAEMAFFGRDETGREIELRGELIYDKYLPRDAVNAMDGDYLSSVYSRAADCWVGCDFGPGETPAVTRIEYCPWSDGNMIERGDRYELLYYDMGWHSLGEKTADDLTLTYDNVPSGAILWLRDLTKGEEERIFTYEGGKQIWW